MGFYRLDGEMSNLRVGWEILLARGTPLIPTKEAGRGSELRVTAGWLQTAFGGCCTTPLLGLRGCGAAALPGMECRLMEADMEGGPCCTVGLT